MATSNASPLRPLLFVIDDEPQISSLLATLLRRSFEVVTFPSAELALAALLPCPRGTAILCDICMPGMSGPQLARQLFEARPDLRPSFLFMSGGVPERISFASGLPPILPKPLDLRDLCSRLDVLTRRSS